MADLMTFAAVSPKYSASYMHGSEIKGSQAG